MIFKLHYWFSAAGGSAASMLLGVYLTYYTDASTVELGTLFMITPFLGLISRPLVCSYADRKQVHKKVIVISLILAIIMYIPYIVIPFLGENFYRSRPRTCWYILVSFKVIGDFVSGSCYSICDTLVINYSRQVGGEFGEHRIWGTISWITHGLVIGMINEVSFLPKYVPAYMILIACVSIDASLFYLWPDEYFRIASEEEIDKLQKKREKSRLTRDGSQDKSSSRTSLMPEGAVWAHIKRKLFSIFTCTSFEQASTNNNRREEAIDVCGDCMTSAKGSGSLTNKYEMSKTTQLRILLILIKKDVRIILYFGLYILLGLELMTTTYFYLNLDKICNNKGLCHYSSLAGMLQAVMALSEVLIFTYVAKLKSIFGRLNMVGTVLLLATIKFGLYATIWDSISPYYSLAIELIQGFIFGTLYTFQIETANEFSGQVEYILPDLIEGGIINEEAANVDLLKKSLKATMQAMMNLASDDFGQGSGAIIYGIIVQRYSFTTLCYFVSLGAGLSCFITFMIIILGSAFNVHLSLKTKFKLKQARDSDRDIAGGQKSVESRDP